MERKEKQNVAEGSNKTWIIFVRVLRELCGVGRKRLDNFCFLAGWIERISWVRQIKFLRERHGKSWRRKSEVRKEQLVEGKKRFLEGERERFCGTQRYLDDSTIKKKFFFLVGRKINKQLSNISLQILMQKQKNF